ncbi:MAG: TraR/DksA family transcriptional regulator [Elusimicrobiota bacterium]|nr:MAG: TraR/DksA family transcriptional regulator [Elusimicrobiota bacterium]
MNRSFTVSNESLTRVEYARARMQLIEMRDALAATTHDLERIRRKQVEAALKKMDNGGYGICESCSRPMLKSRLLAMPYVRYCVSC